MRQAALYATNTIEEIGEQKLLHNDTLNGPQVTFQQVSREHAGHPFLNR